jgi:hypothetical protein
LHGLVVLWVGVLVYTAGFQVFTKMPIGLYLERNWIEIRDNAILSTLGTGLPANVLLTTGLILGCCIDSLRNGKAS